MFCSVFANGLHLSLPGVYVENVAATEGMDDLDDVSHDLLDDQLDALVVSEPYSAVFGSNCADAVSCQDPAIDEYAEYEKLIAEIAVRLSVLRPRAELRVQNATGDTDVVMSAADAKQSAPATAAPSDSASTVALAQTPATATATATAAVQTARTFTGSQPRLVAALHASIAELSREAEEQRIHRFADAFRSSSG